jgi:tRNA 2-(methylsulfanyl)-N6-isopentenyladenosine37 hydroxylase
VSARAVPPAPHEPLRVATPRSWAVAALADPLALLNDHAHLEKKAAANALALLHRWPAQDTAGGAPGDDADWVRALAAIARDETDHLGRVLRVLERRGGRMSRGHRNPYAAALHRHVRRGQGQAEVEDLLCVSALIEARSHEREAAPERDLLALYAALEASERGHHRVFLDLAARLAAPAAHAARWAAWQDLEARAITAQPPGPSMHAGWAGAPRAG